MALNSLFCADVPLSNYSLTHLVDPCRFLLAVFVMLFLCVLWLINDDNAQGHSRLVRALSDIYSPLFGRHIDAYEEILCTVGAYGSLFSAVHALINPGDEVGIYDYN